MNIRHAPNVDRISISRKQTHADPFKYFLTIFPMGRTEAIHDDVLLIFFGGPIAAIYPWWAN